MTRGAGCFRVKTDVVLFGEKLPEQVMERAEAAVKQCSLLLVVGCSLEVSPANSLPQLAKRFGARVVMINREPTLSGSVADICFHGSLAEELLPQLCEIADMNQPS